MDIKKIVTSNTQLSSILLGTGTIEEIRGMLLAYLFNVELLLLNNTDIPEYIQIQKSDSIRILKNIFSKKSLNRNGYDTLTVLVDVLKNNKSVSHTFEKELGMLFDSILNLSKPNIEVTDTSYLEQSGGNISSKRSDCLDTFSVEMEQAFKRFSWGVDGELEEIRRKNKESILKKLKATDGDWKNWNWQISNVIKTSAALKKLVAISEQDEKAIDSCSNNKIPFGITPYYASLMSPDGQTSWDIGIRAQVVPPFSYSQKMSKYGDVEARSKALDFMREHDTSPAPLITRRYPQIAIFKPFNTCPQICVYCQRNWEIKEVLAPGSLASRQLIDKAIAWYKNHPSIHEVLVTGGDPGIMSDSQLSILFKMLYEIPHIKRIRLATRVPITLPMRINESLIEVLKTYHKPPYKEIYVVTHCEHSNEITPEVVDAVQKIRNAGISIYNQQVLTPYNTKRFETSKLRWDLKMIGIDPYYAFYPKGKEETEQYRIPIARALQEIKEEARLLPGNVRTDEPVFNVPFLGKNHLRAYQDRELIAIKETGERVYLMHPWEKNITNVSTYLYEDVSIDVYLDKLKNLGENVEDYKSIWYYY